MAEQRYSGAASHDPLLELQIADSAFVDARVERGGDALLDCGLVLTQGFGQAGQGREARRGELLEPVWQCGCVSGIEHCGELTHQVMGAVQFRAVREQPRESVGGRLRWEGWW